MDELEIDSQQSEEEIPEEIKPVVDKKDPASTKSNFSQFTKKGTESPNNPPYKLSADSWLQKPATEKPDLPGRVSFSSNDVFEIDYSDFSDDSPFDAQERSQKSNKKFVHFRQEQPEATKEEGPSINKMDYGAKSDSSTKIIEDYKKEIESLNRRHEEEMTKLTTEQNEVLFSNNRNLVGGLDAVDSLKNSTVDSYLETIKETDSLEVFEKLETEILAEDDAQEVIEKYEDEEEHEAVVGLSTPKGITLQQTTVTTWDNTKRSDDKVSSSSSEDGKKEEELRPQKGEDDEISRVKFNVKTPKKMSIMANRNFLRKPKTPQTTLLYPIKPPINNPGPPLQPKMRKSKSVSSLKEDNILRDFQIDKVDSWMSMHSNKNKDQVEDSMRTLMLMKRPQSSHQVQYNKEWRDTPSTKTDDEGNFSLEEANDCYSNESTTYDELVSIIKEIEADKKKTDDRKNLQADVEFKLKTEVFDGEVQDVPSDPVRWVI